MSKNLVFTSAGDQTQFHILWPGEGQNFDLVVYYYGKSDENFEAYSKHAKYIERSRGLKFQNFYKFWTTHPDAQQYDRYFILDDDLQFGTNDINKMFEYSEKYQLKICQPSFTNNQYWTITKHRSGVALAYTNFCEVTAPLFTKEALITFLNHYDPILQEAGVDWLFMWANDITQEKSFAVIHDVKCFNPPAASKGNVREIDTFSKMHDRGAIWQNYAKKKGFGAYGTKNYSSIPLGKN